MNYLSDMFVGLSPCYAILLKLTLVMMAGWGSHSLLLNHNPRWRVLLCRMVMIGVFLIPVLEPFQYLSISVSPHLESSPFTTSSLNATPDANETAWQFEAADKADTRSMDTSALVARRSTVSSLDSSSWLQPNFFLLLVFIWLTAAIVFVVRDLLLGLRLKKDIAEAGSVPDAMQQRLNQVANAMDYAKPIDLRHSPAFGSPFIVGAIKPILIVPSYAVQPRCRHELAAIFSHEIAHLLSNDTRWMSVSRLIRHILWFHPLAWILVSSHRAACEEVSDAVGASYVGNVESYCGTLARVAIQVAQPCRALGGVAMAHQADVIHRLRSLKIKLYAESLERHRVLPVKAFGVAACIALGGLTFGYADEATAQFNSKPVSTTDRNSDSQLVRFEARVIDSITGKPVEGFVLFGFRGLDVARSDVQGRLLIDNLTPGEIGFRCGGGKPRESGKTTYYRHGPFGRWWSPDASKPNQRHYIRDRFQRNFDYLEFDLSVDMAPITIVVEQGVTLTGRVFDPSGIPVVGATVAPARTGSGSSITGDTRYSVRTNKDGRYRLVLPASGAVKYNLIAHDGRYGEWRKWGNGVSGAFMTKPSEVIDDKDIWLSETATVHGSVIDTEGIPIPHHKVRLMRFDGQSNKYYVPTAVTDKNGQFVVNFARPGRQYIQAMYFFRNGPGGRIGKFGPVLGPVWSGTPEDGPRGTAQLIDLSVGEDARDIVLVVDFDPR